MGSGTSKISSQGFKIPEIFDEKQLKYDVKSEKCLKNVSECVHIERIVFVLTKHQKYFLSQQSQESDNNYSAHIFINSDLGQNYCDTHLINDYIHILKHHNNPKLYQLEIVNGHKVYKVADLFKIHNKCNAKRCIPIQSLFDDDHNDYKSEPQDIVSSNLLDTIHCNLLHRKYITNRWKYTKFKSNAQFGSNKNGDSHSNDSWTDTVAANYYEIAPRFEYYHNRNIADQFNISAKYLDLKDEILNNKLMNLSLSEWDCVAYKAQKYLQSAYVKNMSRNYSFVVYQEYDYFDRTPMLEKVMSLVLLCDFKKLSISLRNSYCKQFMNETDDELIQRHKEYYNLAKLIEITVLRHGVIQQKWGTTKYIQISLYHSLSNPPMLFSWLRVKWNYPISTTTNLPSFCKTIEDNDNCIMLELDTIDGCYFDCSWISQFGFENEALFMEYAKSSKTPTTSLPIRNIIYPNDVINDTYMTRRQYMDSLHSFIQIMNTETISDREFGSIWDNSGFVWIDRPRERDFGYYQRKEYDLAMKIYTENIIESIQSRFKSNNSNLSIYVKNAVDAYFDTKSELGIDVKLWQKWHHLLSPLFFSKELNRIDIQFIGYLFPKCEALRIYNINELIYRGKYRNHLLNHIYIESLDESFMEWLFEELDAIKGNYGINYDSDNYKQYKLLVDGYIRTIYHDRYVAEDIVRLILLFYPNTCSISCIEFIHIMDHNKSRVYSCRKRNEWLLGYQQLFEKINWNLTVESGEEYDNLKFTLISKNATK